jgi:antirestriction protein ArdC
MAKRSWRERDEEYVKAFGDRIIAQIEKGTAPWQKPWRPGETFLPRNAATGKSYRGGNALYLSATALERGYQEPRWATFKQIKDLDGHVRKGEKGTPIVFTERIREPVVDDAGKRVKDEQGRQQYVETGRTFLKQYTVFNVEQTEGLKLPPLGQTREPEWQAHRRAEIVIDRQNSDIRIEHQHGDRAYYSPKADVVVLPDRGQFPTAGDYYRTALHELGHATGHKDRLDRETLQQGTTEGFGSPAYAREELRAEISSMMTGERIGIGHEPHHGAAYVKSWVAVLKDDPGEIRRAASDAQRMADYLTERPRVREALEREQSRPEPPALAEPDRSPQLPERTRRDQPEREHELEHSR